MTAKKKPNRRNLKKYPALDPSLNLKSRYELIDYDYVDQLSEKDKAWLNKFTEEYVNASFDTKNPKKNLHKTKRLRKDCYDRNNARNRDILTKAKIQGKTQELNPSVIDSGNFEKITEETIIETLDKKKLT